MDFKVFKRDITAILNADVIYCQPLLQNDEEVTARILNKLKYD